MSKKQNLYVGRSGQMAVMSEFLLRGWNVALPEVDVGDDVFVVHDVKGDFFRIQVKAAMGRAQKSGYYAQFSVGQKQLLELRTPELFFIFVTRLENRWDAFVILRQSDLRREHEAHGIGSLNKNGYITFRFTFRDGKATAGKRDLSAYLGDWTRWPEITH